MKIPICLIAIAILIQCHTQAQTFDVTLASRLQKVLDSMKLTTNTKGVSASVFYPGQGKWKGVSGESFAGVPITPNMLFGLGSNTKTFTAVLLLKLAEQQLLNLNDPLSRWLPTYPNINPSITIQQLLHHTSGLADVNDVPGYGDSILSKPNRIYTPNEVLFWVGKPLFAPGTDWGYCNTNYIIAGMIAEKASGISYGQLLHDSIFTPLHLANTFLFVYDTLRGTVAHPWQGGNDRNATPRNALNSVAWSAGAMYSTAEDMVEWYRALMGGELLSGSAFRTMTTFVGSGNYGCGLTQKNILGRVVWEHGGSIWGGYNSQMIYDTVSRAVVAVLTNNNPGQAMQIARQLLATLISMPTTVEETEPSAQPVVVPNPATESVHICLSQEFLENVRVYDIHGREILCFSVADFSVAHLPSGMYSAVIQTSTRRITRSFIKK